MKPEPALVLASGSPRRAALLEQAGVPFRTVATDVDETTPPDWGPERRVRALARRKADAAPPAAGAWTLGADTLGVHPDGRVLGKPLDDADAARMLLDLQGRTHRVLTGVCVLRGADGRRFEGVAETRVTLKPLTRTQVNAYVQTGEPRGKAGAYAIQGLAGAFVRRVEGEYSNVVGLPLALVTDLLAEAGVPLPGHLSPEGA